MSKLTKVLFALSALVVLGVATSTARADDCTVAGNLVTNCGFETGTFAGWTQSGNTGFTSVTTAAAHSGTFGGHFGPVGSLGFLDQTLTTVPGASYNLSFWLRNNSSGTPNHFQAFFNGVLLDDRVNATSFSYTMVSFTGLVATGSSTVLRFAFQHDPSFWDLDDVVVVRAGVASVPEPMTLLLLGTGLAGVATKLRKRALR